MIKRLAAFVAVIVILMGGTLAFARGHQTPYHDIANDKNLWLDADW